MKKYPYSYSLTNEQFVPSSQRFTDYIYSTNPEQALVNIKNLHPERKNICITNWNGE